MASYNCASAIHKTLSSTTADAITLTKTWKEIIVTNGDAAHDVYVTFSMTSSAATVAVAAANDTYVVPKSTSRRFKFGGLGPKFMSVVGNGGDYHVEGF